NEAGGKGAKCLSGRITLSGLQDIIRRDTPATYNMTNPAFLVFEEGQLLVEQECPRARIIQAREAIFAFLDIQWILSKCAAIAGCKGAEDFAGIVQRLGPSEGAAHRQLLEDVVSAELQLQTVVIGVSTV